MKDTDEISEMFYFEVRNDYEAIMTMALPERQLEPVASPSWSLLFSILDKKNYDGEFYSFDTRWIYLVAALCGILLLLTIVLILAKVDHRHQKTKLILECYSWASSRENGQRRRMMLTLWCRQTLRKCD